MIDAQFFIALPIGGIIGWIIREIVSDRLARDRAIDVIKITEFNKAAAIFHAAFIEDIIFIEDTTPSEIYTKILEMILTRGVDKKIITERHRKEMIMFRPYIAECDLPGFDAAWGEYYKLDKNEPDSKEEGEKFALHLNNLLKYAKPKV